MNITKQPDVLQSEIAGEIVLMSMDSERYFALDDITSRIWQLLDTESTLDGLCSRLAEEYEVDPATCRSDVSACIDKMASHGLLTLA